MKRWQWLCMSLMTSGTLVSGYLLFRTFALLTSGAHGPPDVCAAVFGIGCDEALLSATSWQLGIPLAGWGLVYYVTLASILVLAWIIDDAFAPVAMSGAMVLGVLGALSSAILIVVIAAGLAPLCPLCLVVHAVNFSLVGVIERLDGRPIREIGASVRAGLAYVFGAEASRPAAARWHVVGFAVVALVAVVTYQWVLVQSERRAAGLEGRADIEQLIDEFESTARKDITVSTDDARLGPAGAPVELVVFSDFQCPYCLTLAERVYELINRFPDNLTIVFKHFPLGKACNSLVTNDTHPYACSAARAAESAHLQGKFWPFHDALFANGVAGEEAIERAARESGLDMQRFELDQLSEETTRKVQADVDLGVRVGVDGTPTVFINGRRAPGTSLQLLEALIGKQLEAEDS